VKHIVVSFFLFTLPSEEEQ